jgi:predicted metal-dependent phosphoesterase TrpH
MKLDLHLHSRYSFDATSTVAEIISAAVARGLQGIAITDHNTNEALEEIQSLERPGFFIIPGVEVHTTWGDIIGLFCRKFIESRDPVGVAEAIHREGGLVVWPHPSRMNYTAPELLIPHLDAVETFNARNTEVERITPSRGEPRLIELADRLNLAVVGGSDGHSPSEIGNGRTIIPDCSSLDEIKAAIKSGKSQVEGERTSSWSVFGSKLMLRLRRRSAPEEGK